MYYNSFAVALVLSIYICYSFSMRYETKENKMKVSSDLIEFLKTLNFSIYWINVLINNKTINQAQAGYILNIKDNL